MAVLIAGLVVAGSAGYRLFTEKPVHEPQMSRVSGTTDDGWQQVTYRGVTVELPPGWKRLDTAICDRDLERWAAPGEEPCEGEVGLWFIDADTFDPVSGPGVHTSAASDVFPDGGWTGYVTRGDVVVDATDADEAVVRRILQSVGETI
jgi:hypothetical protein